MDFEFPPPPGAGGAVDALRQAGLFNECGSLRVVAPDLSDADLGSSAPSEASATLSEDEVDCEVPPAVVEAQLSPTGGVSCTDQEPGFCRSPKADMSKSRGKQKTPTAPSEVLSL